MVGVVDESEACFAVDESGHDIVYVAPARQSLSSATITRVLQLQSSAWYNLSLTGTWCL